MMTTSVRTVKDPVKRILVVIKMIAARNNLLTFI